MQTEEKQESKEQNVKIEMGKERIGLALQKHI